MNIMGDMNKTTKHPLTKVRESLGLTGIALARLAGINHQRVLVVELGLAESLGWKISRALREHGVDVEQLNVEMMRWRLEKSFNQQKIRER